MFQGVLKGGNMVRILQASDPVVKMTGWVRYGEGWSLTLQKNARWKKKRFIKTRESSYGGFLKWWVSPTTMGVPTKNDHFWCFGRLRKHPYLLAMNTDLKIWIFLVTGIRSCSWKGRPWYHGVRIPSHTSKKYVRRSRVLFCFSDPSEIELRLPTSQGDTFRRPYHPPGATSVQGFHPSALGDISPGTLRNNVVAAMRPSNRVSRCLWLSTDRRPGLKGLLYYPPGN